VFLARREPFDVLLLDSELVGTEAVRTAIRQGSVQAADARIVLYDARTTDGRPRQIEPGELIERVVREIEERTDAPERAAAPTGEAAE
jgi:hypothetical protein